MQYLSDCCGSEVDSETVEEWVSLEDSARCATGPCSCKVDLLGLCPRCDEIKPVSINESAG